MNVITPQKEFLVSELSSTHHKVEELHKIVSTLSQDIAATCDFLQHDKVNNEGNKHHLLTKFSEEVENRIRSLMQDAKDETQTTISLLDERIKSVLATVLQTEKKMEETEKFQQSSTSFHEELAAERNLSSQLKEKVEALQTEVRDGEALRLKWKQDIEEIDKARQQLQQLEGSFTKTDEIAAKMDNMLRINSCIQATSDYLRTETTWVQTQLQNRGIPLATTSASKEDLGKKIIPRKVVLASPVNIVAPSGCVTIEQEQKQRRQGIKPRPILRQQAETNGKPITKERIEQKDVIANIRDSLVKVPSSQSGYFFPTVAEFMSSRLSDNEESLVESSQKSEDESPLAKKQKVGNWASAPGDQVQPASVSRLLFKPSDR